MKVALMALFALLLLISSPVCFGEGDQAAQDDPFEKNAVDYGKPEKWDVSKWVERFREPPLKSRADAAKYPAVRFILSRTFHAPVSLRAYMTPDGPRLRVARMSGKGGYEWGEVEFENDFPLPKNKWDQLMKLVNTDGAREPFKGRDAGLKEGLTALDGSLWVLEVSDASGYTMEEIPNPLRGIDADPEEQKQLEASGFKLNAFVAVCRFLLKYAPMDPDSVY